MKLSIIKLSSFYIFRKLLKEKKNIFFFFLLSILLVFRFYLSIVTFQKIQSFNHPEKQIEYFQKQDQLSTFKRFQSLKMYTIDPEMTSLMMGHSSSLLFFLWLRFIFFHPLEKWKIPDQTSPVYLYLHQLFKLNPHFLPLYEFGAPYLSITLEDSLGASLLYQAGRPYFYQNSWIQFFAGIHFLYEDQSMTERKRKTLALHFFKKSKSLLQKKNSQFQLNQYLLDKMIHRLIQEMPIHTQNKIQKIQEYKKSLKENFPLD
jgi:hypothetical protein